jgi:hypothetical protein
MTSATTGTIYNTFTGEAKTIPLGQAEHLAANSRGEWTFRKPLEPNWDREVPRYRVEVDLHPSGFARHRHEPPFTSSSE